MSGSIHIAPYSYAVLISTRFACSHCSGWIWKLYENDETFALLRSEQKGTRYENTFSKRIFESLRFQKSV